MTSAKLEYIDETPRRPRRSEHTKKAEGDLGHHFLSLIGFAGPVPRHHGDNQGFWPIHIEVNADWRQSGVVFDRQQPAHRAVRFDVIGVGNRADAVALKGALDEALHGREEQMQTDGLRHRFRNAVNYGPLDHWWGELLVDAALTVTGGMRQLKLFSRDEHERMVAAEERRQMVHQGH